jgi:hypothetical protein
LEVDSLVFIGRKGPTYGWQQTLDNYKKNYPDAAAMGQLDFSGLRVTLVAPTAAQVVGRWHLARPAAGDLQGYFLLVLRQIDGSGWWWLTTRIALCPDAGTSPPGPSPQERGSQGSAAVRRMKN